MSSPAVRNRTFTFNEGSLDLPGGWEDRSVIALSFPEGSKNPDASFAITRDASALQDRSLGAYVDRQMVDMAKTCPRFELVRREQGVLDGRGVEKLEFTWRSPNGSFVHQRQTILLLSSGAALTFTGTAAENRFSEYADVFARLVETFRLRTLD
jgi:hypothetical protein